MARTMSIDNTDIYRAVVDELYPSSKLNDRLGRMGTTVYGPHDSKSQNKDWTNGGGGSNNPRRITKQQLAPVHTEESDGHPALTLEWFTYSVTYKNGGEDVNWDEF